MTLRLRCIRCGDGADMDPSDAYGWGLCPGCQRKMCAAIEADWERENPHRLAHYMRRWQRDMERHPTHKALCAALEAEGEG